MYAPWEAGVKIGYMISKLEQRERESGDLRERAAQLPPEQQFTFALIQTRSVEQLWRTVEPEMLLQLTAGILGVTEKSLQAELDEAVRIAWERMEDMGGL